MENAFTDVLYDDNVFNYLLHECNTYEELRLQCDMHGIECIIAENEFKDYVESRPWRTITA